MTSPVGVTGGVQLAVVAWKVFQMGRAPRDVPLRIVTISLACGSGAYLFSNLANAVGTAPTMPIFLLGHNVLLAGSLFSLNCFFWYSALDTASAMRQIRRGGWLLGVVLVLISVAALRIPPGVSNTDPSMLSLPAVAVLNLTTDGYLIASLITATVWALRCAREATPVVTRALRVAAVGLIAAAAGGALLIPDQIARWVTHSEMTTLAEIGAMMTLTGIVVFLTSVSYPSAVMRVAAARIWWQHWRTYHRLQPLWTPLHHAFPQDTLDNRVPTHTWWDVLNPWGVHRRYYRRAIEIRDGLVRLSPYISAYDADASTPPARARLIRRALDDAVTGHAAESPPVSVAQPNQPGLAADVAELVSLATALDRIEPTHRRQNRS